MRPKWPKLASLAQKICKLLFQFLDAFFASKGYPFETIFHTCTFKIRFRMKCFFDSDMPAAMKIS